MLHLDEREIRALEQLIRRLERTSPLSREQASKLWEARSRRISQRMAALGETFGQASGAPTHLTQGEAHFRAEMRRVADSLVDQVMIVQTMLDDWFFHGDDLAPYYPARIPVILRKGKAFELERRYLEAWIPHLGAMHSESSRVLSMVERMRKIGVRAAT